jgi:hypothetical protein
MSFPLTKQDRDLLRGIVRKVHFAHVEAKHGKGFIGDHECDKLIDSLGPEIAERMIRFGVDKGLR